MHSGLFLDFLAGNQDLRVHAVGHAGAQHLRLAEALLPARRRLHQDLQGADGDHRLGDLRHRQVREVRRLHGALRLRADRGQCRADNPFKAMWVALRGMRTTGPMAPEINLENQRPAQYIFSAEVQKRLSEIRRDEAAAAAAKRSRRPPPPPERGGSRLDRSSGIANRTRRALRARACNRLPAVRTRRRALAASRKPRQPRRVRSARLKSIPVETSARSVIGLRATPRSTLRRSMSPFGLIAAIASAGKRAAGGVADDAQRRERKARLGRIGGRDMAFHIDRGRAGLRVQRGLAGRRCDHLFHAGQTAPDHAPAPQRDAGDQIFIQRQTGQPAGVAGQHLGRHHHVAGLQ